MEIKLQVQTNEFENKISPETLKSITYIITYLLIKVMFSFY